MDHSCRCCLSDDDLEQVTLSKQSPEHAKFNTTWSRDDRQNFRRYCIYLMTGRILSIYEPSDQRLTTCNARFMEPLICWRSADMHVNQIRPIEYLRMQDDPSGTENRTDLTRCRLENEKAHIHIHKDIQTVTRKPHAVRVTT
jgi:hypothetical protein